MVVTLEEMKNYLRVDFDDDDALLEGIIAQSQQICMDVARFTDLEEFEKQPVSKIAVMYAVAYLYEHTVVWKILLPIIVHICLEPRMEASSDMMA